MNFHKDQIIKRVFTAFGKTYNVYYEIKDFAEVMFKPSAYIVLVNHRDPLGSFVSLEELQKDYILIN